jgi:hypothetical protein
MTDTPIHHWTMDDLSGTNVLDDIAGGVSLAASNWSQITGKFGYGLSQPDTTYPLSLPADTAFQAISFWIRRIDTVKYSDFACNSAGNRLVAVKPAAEGSWLYFYNGVTGPNTSLAISDTTWHHVMLVQGTDTNHHWLWLDGVKDATGEKLSNLAGVIRYISRPPGAGPQENCAVDNIQWYDRVPTDDEIAYLAAATSQTQTLPIPVGKTSLAAILVQSYILEGSPRVLLDQDWALLLSLRNVVNQDWSLRMLQILAQYYGDAPVVRQLLDQYWGAAAELKKILREVYGSNPAVQNTLTESYNLLTSLLSRSDARYSLIGDQLVNYVGAIYALNDSDKLLSALRERYAIALGGTSGQISASVNIAGGVVASGGFNLTYSMDEYCGSCDVTINNEQSWENINYLDPIVLTIESNTYNFVVVEKYLAESPGKPVFRIRGRSHSVTLDFPHATEIKDDLLVNGLCSEVVDAIAGIGGKAVDWYIPADESITAKDVQIAGSSPMGAIKKIVNEFRAVVQTSPDGTIRAIPSHNVNTDKYNVSTITATIDAIKEVSSCEWGSEKRQGYNKYFVSNQAATGGYVLESKAMSEILDHIMASIVPWTNKPVYLTTSELTNVWIEAKGITEEIIEEEVEIKNGSGKLQKPWYGTISVDYGTRIDLGTPVFVEDGSLSVAGLASSMAMVKYKTRYWLWAVTGTDKENVQYILMSY